MDVFALREELVSDYRHYAESFLSGQGRADPGARRSRAREGLLWPDPIVQLNPAFEPGGTVDELVAEGLLDERCSRDLPRAGSGRADSERRAASSASPSARGDRGGPGGRELRADDRHGIGQEPRLHRPDRRSRSAATARGEGDPGDRRVSDERARQQPGGRAGEVPLARLPGREAARSRSGATRARRATRSGRRSCAHPPDILLTNYVMLELILTRPYERQDRRGGAGSRVPRPGRAAHLPRPPGRRRRAARPARSRGLQRDRACSCVGTSATLAGPGTLGRAARRGRRASPRCLFGAAVEPDSVIGETLRRATAPTSTRRPGLPSSALDGARRAATPPDDLEEFDRRSARLLDRDDARASSGAGDGRLRRAPAAPDDAARRAPPRAGRAHRAPPQIAARRDPRDAAARLPSSAARERLPGVRVPAAPVLQRAARRSTPRSSPRTSATSRPASSSSCPATARRSCSRSRSAASAARSTTRSATGRGDAGGPWSRRAGSPTRQRRRETSDDGFLYFSGDEPWPSERRRAARARPRRLARAPRRRNASSAATASICRSRSASTPAAASAETGSRSTSSPRRSGSA